MRDDIAFGQRPAPRAELGLQILEKAEVEVNVLVLRAVERADCSRSHTTAG